MSWIKRASAWWRGSRVPEPEAMDCPDEVEAYAGAAAQRHLARLDGGAARRMAAAAPGARRALDLGCGPAGIPLSVAVRLPASRVVGIDLSLPMLRRARLEARRLGLDRRVHFVLASATDLPFRSGCFGLIMSNSLVHHLPRPERAVTEAARVSGAGAAFFVRDLRRPPRPCLAAHLRLFGRHYRGVMRRLFEDSVRAAYTRSEMRRLVAPLGGVRVRRRGWVHLEAVRSAEEP